MTQADFEIRFFITILLDNLKSNHRLTQMNTEELLIEVARTDCRPIALRQSGRQRYFGENEQNDTVQICVYLCSSAISKLEFNTK